MLTKLAFRNIGKSFKDYAIYFFTLVMGVCIFYLFNSIYAQKEIMEVTQATNQAMQSLQTTLSYISIFVAIVLGFLIVYANRFFIKRRKKELGIYMTLGMTKGSISTILLLETSLLALAALGVGLVLGIFGSQFMSVFTAKIFEADMSAFKFVFSMDAVVKSILYFGVIFLVVMVFNISTVRKCKLIDLLYGGRHNEKQVMPKIGISVALFALSVLCLTTAYVLILKNGIVDINIIFLLSIILGVVGTLLFFFSLAGLLMAFIQKNKTLYFKGLNMFVLRQLGSKINTNFVSISVVCLVLLLVIGIFSCGYSMQSIMSSDLKAGAPYDFSLFSYGTHDFEPVSIWDSLPDELKQFEEIAAWDEYDIHGNDLTYGDLQMQDSKDAFFKTPLEFISTKEYNEILEFSGQPALELAKDNYAIISGSNNPMVESMEEEKPSIKLDDVVLTPIPTEQTISPSNNPYDLMIAVDETYLSEMPVIDRILNIQCRDEIAAQDFDAMLRNYLHQAYQDTGSAAFTYFNSKAEFYAGSVTTKAIVSFLAIYLGFVFMIVCASILAIQQLSEASNNRERYQLLKKLGAEPKMIRKALFTQILCYFLFPLLLAIVHAIVGLTAASKVIAQFGQMDAAGSIFATGCFMIGIYGIYFWLTYSGSKAMIRENG